jgi:hypothetical protein
MTTGTRRYQTVRVNSVRAAKRLLTRAMRQLQNDEISAEKARTLAYLANSYIKIADAAGEEPESARDASMRRKAKRELDRRGITAVRREISARRRAKFAAEAGRREANDEPEPAETAHEQAEITGRAQSKPAQKTAGKPATQTPGGQAGEGTGKVEQPERGGAALIVLNSRGESVRLTATSPPRGPIGGGNGGIRFPGY